MPFKRVGSIVLVFMSAYFLAVHADFYPERIYKERSQIKLNTGWTFYSEMRGNAPAPGKPYEAAYSDNSWTKVNIPSSASYDAPTKVGEDKTITGGTCWYRKKFTIPGAAKHTGKLFLQFDGAMQTASVWLNGTLLGVHDNSGYTGFRFDITDKTVASDNVLVVKLDNTYNSAIPPGNNGETDRTSISSVDYTAMYGLYAPINATSPSMASKYRFREKTPL